MTLLFDISQGIRYALLSEPPLILELDSRDSSPCARSVSRSRSPIQSHSPMQCLALDQWRTQLRSLALWVGSAYHTVSARRLHIENMSMPILPHDFSDKRQLIQGPEGYSFNVLEHLAGISPYFDSPGVHLDPSPPEGCHVSEATYLVRHSNIYANDVSPYIINTHISGVT